MSAKPVVAGREPETDGGRTAAGWRGELSRCPTHRRIQRENRSGRCPTRDGPARRVPAEKAAEPRRRRRETAREQRKRDSKTRMARCRSVDRARRAASVHEARLGQRRLRHTARGYDRTTVHQRSPGGARPHPDLPRGRSGGGGARRGTPRDGAGGRTSTRRCRAGSAIAEPGSARFQRSRSAADVREDALASWIRAAVGESTPSRSCGR